MIQNPQTLLDMLKEYPATVEDQQYNIEYGGWAAKDTFYDPVQNPSHYVSGGIETIDYIEAKLGTDGAYAFCMGNVLKYVSRAGKKDVGKELEDLEKAQWYLKKAIDYASL